MAVTTFQIVEHTYSIQEMTTQDVMPLLPEHLKDQESHLEDHVAYILDECLKAATPKGVYKLFNPAICTLPPDYTEPGIKLVGTMAVLKGEEVYNRMRRATHCVIMAVSACSSDAVEALRERLCRVSSDEAILDACIQAITLRVADMTNNAIVCDALDRGLQTDDFLTPGTDTFPLEMNSLLSFYVQTESRLGIKVNKETMAFPTWGLLGVVGMYDPSQSNRRRACGRCKFRSYCPIRAIGMNCHGRKGTFKKVSPAE